MVKLKVRNMLSRDVQVRTGLQQGNKLNLIIFNVVLVNVVRIINVLSGDCEKLTDL